MPSPHGVAPLCVLGAASPTERDGYHPAQLAEQRVWLAKFGWQAYVAEG